MTEFLKSVAGSAWFIITVGVASLFGLLFSILAWGQAKSASEAAENASVAAENARKAITIRTLAEEFQLACGRMDQLLDFIEHDRFAEAALRARELASALGEIPYRRSSLLVQNNINELLSKRTQIEIIGKELMSTKRGEPLSPESKKRLFAKAQDTSASLRKNLGIIKGEIDRGTRQ